MTVAFAYPAVGVAKAAAVALAAVVVAATAQSLLVRILPRVVLVRRVVVYAGYRRRL